MPDKVISKELVEVVQARRIETVTGDFLQDPGEPFWRIEIDGYCGDFDYEAAANNFATAINARIASVRLSAEAAIVAWQPIETAPKDGTLLELVVDYTIGDHPLNDATRACTIGFNSFDDDGVDEWKFAGWCWSHDHFVEGAGKVIAWRPSRLNASDDELPPLPAPPADTLEQGKIRHG